MIETKMKSKKYLIIAILSITLFGCKVENANTVNTNNNTNSAAKGAETNKNSTANTVVNTNANVSKKASTDNSPKRISFSKGANWGAVNITLAAGAAQKFVVSAKKGQTMDVEVSSKETSVNLIKGKAQTTEDFGYLNAELQANGDYIFEVRNSTKKEIKTSVKVTVEGAEPVQRGNLNDVDEANADGAEDNNEEN